MICWERVNELREEVGAEDFLEVVEIFLEEVDEAVGRLKAGPEADTLESELHFLKGSALNLGFAKMGELCSHGEMLAREQGPEAVDLAELVSVYERSRSEFLAGSAERKIAAA